MHSDVSRCAKPAAESRSRSGGCTACVLVREFLGAVAKTIKPSNTEPCIDSTTIITHVHPGNLQHSPSITAVKHFRTSNSSNQNMPAYYVR
jgi:hypothetical protein